MKKIILTIAFIATGMVASAQVGVGTENPETSLEVVGKNANVTTKAAGALDTADGITVPVVTNDMTITVANGTPAGSRVSQMVYSNFAGKAGYYFWDGDKWNSMVPAAVAPSPYRLHLGQVLVAGVYNWANNANYDFYEFTDTTGSLTLPAPNDPLFSGRKINISNRAQASFNFGGTNGIGTPKGLSSLTVLSSVEIYSNGSVWYVTAGRP